MRKVERWSSGDFHKTDRAGAHMKHFAMPKENAKKEMVLHIRVVPIEETPIAKLPAKKTIEPYETISMKFKGGHFVAANGDAATTFKVIDLSADAKTAEIQPFNISKQVLLGAPIGNVPTSTLIPFREDVSQGVARVGWQAAED
jgi:hypothetical protein